MKNVVFALAACFFLLLIPDDNILRIIDFELHTRINILQLFVQNLAVIFVLNS